ncbi:MAG TPA: hydrogenase nickel incorporation protein HypB [Bacteroidales bacterium]|nr:hydrogenase nickel incorporation protein HypB [Bacteroidales bacterium]HPS73407.1 hydrogenase nickel incorporation protein HypB [Bacteroidales bacterium]
MCETCGCGEKEHDHEDLFPEENRRLVEVKQSVLQEDRAFAEKNRQLFRERHITCLNVVSSPGSGKTLLLERSIRGLLPFSAVTVIEGDQQTTRDSDRIRKAGATAFQINTGLGCHLTARMIHEVVSSHVLPENSILFIENVGNLVCPAMFDLGETKRVVIMSVTEGDDKPAKYPFMFYSSDICLINKMDLLPYVDYSIDAALHDLKHIKPGMEVLYLSLKDGTGMGGWIDWIRKTHNNRP